MLEYASIRLTFDCATPTTVPTIIVAAATIQTNGDPTRAAQRLERATRNTRDERRERRGLHARGHEAGDRRRRAFVGVGRPHVERHRRHLEREPDEQQAERQQLHRRGRQRLRGNQAADPVELRAAGHAVRERDAVEEERARERAEQEIFERRLDARPASRGGFPSST